MKKSLRAKRMEKHHARNKTATLNLTSLIDIFTILLFFLLVNTGDGTQIVDTEKLKMPLSTATEQPKQVMVLQVDGSEIVLEGRKIANVADAIDSQELVIAELDQELRYQEKRLPPMTEEEKEFGRAITIQADRALPYQVLKKVMTTCAMAEFRNISLAVTQSGGSK